MSGRHSSTPARFSSFRQIAANSGTLARDSAIDTSSTSGSSSDCWTMNCFTRMPPWPSVSCN
nr:hypothetical protein [Burkholderia pseudomallei]